MSMMRVDRYQPCGMECATNDWGSDSGSSNGDTGRCTKSPNGTIETAKPSIKASRLRREKQAAYSFLEKATAPLDVRGRFCTLIDWEV
jgi:hypothetical protein